MDIYKQMGLFIKSGFNRHLLLGSRHPLCVATHVRGVCLILFLALALANHAENYPYKSDVLWVTVPDHADWLYKTGEKAQVEVEFYKYGIPRDAEVTYEIAPDMLPATSSGKVKMKNGRATIDIGTMAKPGFRDCRLTTVVDGVTYKHHVKVGFSPERLEPYTMLPADFDSFWDKAKQDAAKFPLKYTMTRVDKYSTDDTECYLIKLTTDSHGHCIYGYLTRPVKKGKYPVVLCPPGAGIKTIKEPMRHIYYAKNGFIRLEMEIHGLNPELSDSDFKDISAAFNSQENGYLSDGIESRDNYYMKHVYLACVRCIDLLTSLDDWDGKNVITQGGSQGGALSIITAALSSKVTLCVANHPALSDMAGYLSGTRCGGYPHFNKSMLTPDNVKTLAYYDVVNFARRLHATTYMTWGYNDITCPPTTSYIVYNLIRAPKESLITPINEHWTSDATEYGLMEWIKGKLAPHPFFAKEGNDSRTK